MKLKLDSEIIQEIKSRLDIVEVASKFLEVKQKGNRWVSLCPFHQETKPSFYLNRELGLYYCFGCQASGDIIDLFCKLKGVDFIDGIKELAEEAGITLFEHRKRTSRISKKDYIKINLIASNYFKEHLKSNTRALNYLKKRGISYDLIKKFEIGFAPEKWEGLKNYLIKQDISTELALETGLLSKKGDKTFDRFRNRIIFPITDIGGEVVGFGGRIVGDGEPKYLNTNETAYFKKGQILYGLFQGKRAIRSKNCAIITEGYVDLITLFQHGFENSCAVLGTALTEDHVKKLNSLCNQIIIVFDGDVAGERASFKSAEMFLVKGFEVKVVTLPDGEDIDSFLKTRGKEEFEKYIDLAYNGIDFCIKVLKNSSPKNIMGWCVNFLKKIDDFALKAYYLPRISHSLKISEEYLRKAIGPKTQNHKVFFNNLTENKKEEIPLRDKEFLGFAINYPNYFEVLKKENMESVFDSNLIKSIWKKLITYGHKYVLDYLDNNERSIYIELAIKFSKNTPSEIVYKEILDRIKEIKRFKLKSALKKQIEEAEKNKDFEKLKMLLKEYQTI